MKGPRTRAAIVEAAGRVFSERGYEAATLEQIAADLGITRSTVLFHFKSKRALLLAIIAPLYTDVESMLSEFSSDLEGGKVPLGPHRRRQLLSRYCEVLIAHRHATILLVRDLTTITQMQWPSTGPAVTQQLMTLLQGHDPDRDLRLRTASAIGAMLRPICQPPIAPDELDAGAREVIVGNALAAYSAKTR